MMLNEISPLISKCSQIRRVNIDSGSLLASPLHWVFKSVRAPQNNKLNQLNWLVKLVKKKYWEKMKSKQFPGYLTEPEQELNTYLEVEKGGKWLSKEALATCWVIPGAWCLSFCLKQTCTGSVPSSQARQNETSGFILVSASGSVY